jgi:hypothetical protein
VNVEPEATVREKIQQQVGGKRAGK